MKVKSVGGGTLIYFDLRAVDVQVHYTFENILKHKFTDLVQIRAFSTSMSRYLVHALVLKYNYSTGIGIVVRM